MKGTSETKILSLRIHDALVKVRVPGYLEAHECSFDHPLSEFGIQVHRNNFAR
jgi:hypothetical protein